MKTCFKCGVEKPLTEYYKHPRMGDGHLNKCKECTKSDSQKTYEKITSTPELAIKERARQRLKEHNRRLQGKTKKYKYHKAKRPANIIMGNAVRKGTLVKKPCEVCGANKSHGHHEDYDRPLDVIWLCPRHHSDRHIHLRDCKTLNKEPLPIYEFIEKLKIILDLFPKR
jgi:hypothetical protein